MAMATLQTVWELAQAAGEPHTVIRVRNLQTSLRIGKDAWGREEKLQPVLISTSVSLRVPFESASSEDAVTKSTVHYGILSKAILEVCDNIIALPKPQLATLHSLVYRIHTHLLDSVLASSALKSLEINVMLPKASLIGNGVSLTSTLAFDTAQSTPSTRSDLLALHGLRIPTLIGVNSNERLAKQIVVANIQVDPWHNMHDAYNELEEITVKTIEESSFHTLEALATHLGYRIIQYFLIPNFGTENNLDGRYHRVRICLEKPTAVTFADAPLIEIMLDSDPRSSKAVETIWRTRTGLRKPPYPLLMRLDKWIRDENAECGVILQESSAEQLRDFKRLEEYESNA